MTLLDAVWLALIQAITEFLPVSSSGHLRLFREFFIPALKVDLRYDLFLHIGTLLAVLLYYRQRLWSLGRSFFQGLTQLRTPGFLQSPAAEGLYYAAMLVLGTAPTIACGLVFRKLVNSDAISTFVIGFLLVVNAGVLYLAHRRSRTLLQAKYGDVNLTEAAEAADPNDDSIRSLKPLHAVIIGVAQGFAVFPGISRSGSTIAAALICGQSRERAVEFSFFLSVIAVAGAITLEMLGGPPEQVPIPTAAWILGFAITLLGGFAALAALRLIVKRGGLEYFAVYCAGLGVLTMVLTA